MKIILLNVLLSLPVLMHAQGKEENSNIFHDRSYWKSSPSVKNVKGKIKEGNDPVAFNMFSFDAVTYAILENAPIKTITYLLSIEGNEVTKPTHDSRSYLLWAGHKGNLELVELLLEMKSDIHLIDDHGYGILTFTAVGGVEDQDLYDFLLSKGASINEENRSGANALLLLAPRLQDEATLAYFQEKGLDIKSQDNKGNGIIHYAVQRGNLALIRKLINMGLPYNTLNAKEENLVFMASHGARSHSNPIEVYQYLDSLGLEINVSNTEGQNPLHGIAKSNKSKEVFDFFIKQGVNPNQVDNEGNTPFLNAAKSRNLEMVKELIELVEDIDQKNKEGYSALTFAVKRGNQELFDFLIEKGADIEVKDASNNNLYYHLFDGYSSRTSDNFNTILTTLKSANVSFKNASDVSLPLHMAIEKNYVFLVKTTLELGADVNQRNQDGLTALHLAAMKSRNSEILMFLLENGADKELRTEFGESAFDLAQENELLKANQTDLTFLK